MYSLWILYALIGWIKMPFESLNDNFIILIGLYSTDSMAFIVFTCFKEFNKIEMSLTP